MATATTKSKRAKKKKPEPHDDVATPIEQAAPESPPETPPADGDEASQADGTASTEAIPQADSQEAEPPKDPPVATAAPGEEEPAEDKKLRLIREEKERLESLLCQQSYDLDEATMEFNSSNETTKELKKRVESRQTALEDTARDLKAVLEGRWKPNPQQKLPFKDESESIGTRKGSPEPDGGNPPAEVASSLWRSTPLSELGFSKNLINKLEEHGYTNLGGLKDEIEVGGKLESLDGVGERSVKKIRKTIDEWFARHPIPTSEAAPVTPATETPSEGEAAKPEDAATAEEAPQESASEAPSTEQREKNREAYTAGCVACADGKPITDNPYFEHDPRHAHWNDGWNETENGGK